jgi:hypothetical protein
MYPDLSANTCWMTLYDGLKCTNMSAAMKMLWDGVQTEIGELKGRSILVREGQKGAMDGC